MTRPRAADDFAAIRARMEELRREREEGAHTAESEGERNNLAMPRSKRALAAVRDQLAAGRVRQS